MMFKLKTLLKLSDFFRCDVCYGGSTNVTSNAGIDKCGSCILADPLTKSTGSESHVYSRRKRELPLLIKRSVVEGEECPCDTNEERDACGVCKRKGESNTQGLF